MDRKDVFKEFRDKVHALEEHPSHQAWRRLEGRLEVHRNRGRSSLYRSLAMVAAVVALVSITFVVSLLLDLRHQVPLAEADIMAVPLTMEELRSYSDVSEEAYKIVEFRRQHTSRMSNPIAEGEPGKKLLPTPGWSQSVSDAPPSDVAPSQRAATLHPALSALAWLQGEWQGAAQEGRVFEQWAITDANTLKGQSYIEHNGKQVFKEKILIQWQNGEVFYRLPLANPERWIQYKLVLVAENTAIFENPAIDFPDQVVLELEDGQHFRTILQNKNPARIKPGQEAYLSERFAIQPERAMRRLTRVR